MTNHSVSQEEQRTNQLVSLLERISYGDEAALGLFYDQTHSRAYGLALKVTRRRDLAEEVCVEAYWQVWREATRFDSRRGQPLAWLMIIVRTRALDSMRRLDPAETHEDMGQFDSAESGLQGSALENLLNEEKNTALKQALDTLTPAQRQVIALAFYKDMSHQEISEHMGLPVGTVKSHIKRAQTRLRDAIVER